MQWLKSSATSLSLTQLARRFQRKDVMVLRVNWWPGRYYIVTWIIASLDSRIKEEKRRTSLAGSSNVLRYWPHLWKLCHSSQLDKNCQWPLLLVMGMLGHSVEASMVSRLTRGTYIFHLGRRSAVIWTRQLLQPLTQLLHVVPQSLTLPWNPQLLKENLTTNGTLTLLDPMGCHSQGRRQQEGASKSWATRQPRVKHKTQNKLKSCVSLTSDWPTADLVCNLFSSSRSS